MKGELLIKKYCSGSLIGFSRRLFLLMAFSIPLSIEFGLFNFRVTLPSEFLIGIECLMLIFVFFSFKEKLTSVFRETFSKFYLLYLIWMLLMIPFSEYPIVSLKYFIVSSAHFWCFFIGGYILLKHFGEIIFLQSILAYFLSFSGIIVYGWYNHSLYNFRMDASVLTAKPFYFDHTMYGTAMALIMPILLYYFRKSLLKKDSIKAIFYLVVSTILALGIYLSFSRATWLSFTISLFTISFIAFTAKYIKQFRFTIMTTSLLLVIALILSLISMAKNNNFESKKGDIKSHILSSLNMTNDVSNLERINRYKTAIRMFKQRPISGFGAGTYPLSFAPFQKPEEMTRISVSPHGIPPPGRGGSTHSEYLRALAELGMPGFIFWTGIILAGVWKCIKTWLLHPHICFSLFCLWALLSFALHGMVNNFYQSEKISFLFCIILSFVFWKSKNIEQLTLHDVKKAP